MDDFEKFVNKRAEERQQHQQLQAPPPERTNFNDNLVGVIIIVLFAWIGGLVAVNEGFLTFQHMVFVAFFGALAINMTFRAYSDKPSGCLVSMAGFSVAFFANIIETAIQRGDNVGEELFSTAIFLIVIFVIIVAIGAFQKMSEY